MACPLPCSAVWFRPPRAIQLFSLNMDMLNRVGHAHKAFLIASNGLTCTIQTCPRTIVINALCAWSWSSCQVTLCHQAEWSCLTAMAPVVAAIYDAPW